MIERLILIRHGKTEAEAASGEDFDRALTERGRVESQEAGRRLAEAGFPIDIALVSPAVRAGQTWNEIAPAHPTARVVWSRDLYHAGAGEILELAREASAGGGTVAVVGHNPGTHALAFDLAVRGMAEPALIRRLREGFSTASAAVFRLDGLKPTYEGLFVPKDER